MSDEPINPETIKGYAHGKANYRRGVGFPRGYRPPESRGPSGEPASAFTSKAYGDGYVQGWLELAADRVLGAGQ